jgi:spermidine/putrescine transport system ATP-binding protein
MTADAATSPALVLRSLVRQFGSAEPVVRGVDLVVPDGEFFSLIGPSGCGKTTTLRMIAGLEDVTSGTIEVHGIDVTQMPAYKRPVHTVFQNYALFPHLSVVENVGFGLRERHQPKDVVRRRVREMLELVELTGREQARPRELSGGMQQRVALARALVLDPQVLLLDEPLGALDLRLRRQMQLLLKTVQREVGITFVYVTHDQEEAFSMSDRVAIMSGGELVQVASPRQVYERPATRFVADFVGASNQLPGRVIAAKDDGYEVELAGLGSLQVPGVAGLTPGTEVAAVLRPEAAALSTGTANDDLVLDGVVGDVSFRGPQTSVLVNCAAGPAITVLAASQSVPPGLAPGSPVQIQVCARDLWVIRP